MHPDDGKYSTSELSVRLNYSVNGVARSKIVARK